MPKNLYKRAGIWWGRKIYKGKRHRFSLETTSLREAQKRYEARIGELIATAWGEKPKRTFDEAAEKFVDEHFPTLRPASAERYIVSLRRLADVFAGMALEDISSAALYEFEQLRYRNGATKPTIRRDLACLSSMLSSCQYWEWLTVNPVPAYTKARGKKGLRESPPRTRYLSHPEEGRLLPTCKARLADAVVFAIHTGLRKQEQFRLMDHHIDMTRKEILVDRTIAKNGHERRVPILEPAMEILRRRNISRRSRYIFTNEDGQPYSHHSNYMLKLLKAAAGRAGISDLIWHDLRRTCGCRLLQDYGATMKEVSDWLGHSSVVVTEQRYAFLRVDDLHRRVSEEAQKEPQRIMKLRKV
jgi:integrase